MERTKRRGLKEPIMVFDLRLEQVEGKRRKMAAALCLTCSNRDRLNRFKNGYCHVCLMKQEKERALKRKRKKDTEFSRKAEIAGYLEEIKRLTSIVQKQELQINRINLEAQKKRG